MSTVNAPEASAALTADGGADGYLTVATNAGFYSGATAYLSSGLIASREVKVVSFTGGTKIGVQFTSGAKFTTGGSPSGRSNVSAYLLADGAVIKMPAQEVLSGNVAPDGPYVPLTATVIQQLVDAAGVAGGIVDLPGRSITLDAPLTLNQSGVGLEGLKGVTKLVQSPTVRGPLIKIGQALGPLELVPSLVPGPGYAWDLLTEWEGGGRHNGKYFNLREQPSLNLNGATGLCFEFFIRANQSAIGTASSIIHSRAKRYAGDADNRALSVVSFGDRIAASMTIGGSVINATTPGGSLDGAVHHVCVEYDGSAVKVYIDGIQRASTAASGTVTMKPWEDFTIGVEVAENPCLGFDNHGRDVLDSIRLTTAAIHNGPFVPPTTKHSYWSGQTALLLNFESVTADYVIQPGLDGLLTILPNVYYPIQSGDPILAQADTCSVRGVNLQGQSGIFANRAIRLRVSDCSFNCDNYGVWANDNSFFFAIRDCDFLIGGVGTGYAIAMAHASSGSVRDCSVTGGVTVLNPAGEMASCYLNYNGPDYALRLINRAENNEYTFNAIQLSDEGGVGTSAMLIMDSVDAANFVGCTLERISSEGPIVDVYGDVGATFLGSSFSLAGVSPPEIFHAINNPARTKGITLLGSLSRTPSLVAWSSTVGLVRVL